MKLKEILDSYMGKVPEVKEYCERCLRTERWDGNIVLMIVDAAFTSIGLNYFKSVVPHVEDFRKLFVETGKIRTVENLLAARNNDLKRVWQSRRSWQMAKATASYLMEVKQEKGLDDRAAFIYWATHSKLEEWQKDPVGQIKGVGINTFQYLRMMGGVDTIMPDKVVKRVIREILEKAGIEMPQDDTGFIKLVEQIAGDTSYKAIELCWMTWLIQSESGLSRMEKYSAVLPRI